DAPARREYPKALAHAGLDQVVPVLAPREPIVVAVVGNAAVIGWTRDDEMHTPVWQWKCARIAVPHLHATVVVNRLTRCINSLAIRRFSSSSDINHVSDSSRVSYGAKAFVPRPSLSCLPS